MLWISGPLLFSPVLWDTECILWGPFLGNDFALIPVRTKVKILSFFISGTDSNQLRSIWSVYDEFVTMFRWWIL